MNKRDFNVLLIATSQINLGLKSVSGALLNSGYEPRVIFMDVVSEYYKPSVLAELDIFLSKVDLIGISTIEISFKRTVQIINYIKSKDPHKTVVVGGIYALLNPEKCISYADVVCIGEGEQTIVELADAIYQKRDIDCIENIWVRKSNLEVYNNKRFHLIEDLDSLPRPDHFSPERHYYLNHKGKFEQSENLIQPARATLDYVYNFYVMFSRGCHLSCSYCSVPALKEIFRGSGKFLRKRSIGSTISELEQIVKSVPKLDFVYLFDDDFLIRSIDEINEFSKKYREKIGVPFFCYGTPKSTSKEKIALLLDAGLTKFVFGIQSGSDKILEQIYNRHEFRKYIMKAAEELSQAINEYYGKTGRRLIPTFDIIYNNPWEEKEDLLDSIDIVRKMSEYFEEFILFSMPLNIFESTALYKKAIEDGFIGTNATDVERKVDISYQQAVENLRRNSKHLYLNAILYLMRYSHTKKRAGFIPRSWLDKFLLAPNMVTKAERLDRNVVFRFIILSILFILPTRDRKFFIKLKIKNFLKN